LCQEEYKIGFMPNFFKWSKNRILIISSPIPPSPLITIVLPGYAPPSQNFNFKFSSNKGFVGLKVLIKPLIPLAVCPSLNNLPDNEYSIVSATSS
jgi:hypothetical protein